MSASVTGSADHFGDYGVSRALRIGKQILNALTERAAVAADRSRFAALPQRYLDDIGMTAGERAEVLHYEEPMIDGWRVVASHL